MAREATRRFHEGFDHSHEWQQISPWRKQRVGTVHTRPICFSEPRAVLDMCSVPASQFASTNNWVLFNRWDNSTSTAIRNGHLGRHQVKFNSHAFWGFLSFRNRLWCCKLGWWGGIVSNRFVKLLGPLQYRSFLMVLVTSFARYLNCFFIASTLSNIL